MAGNRWRLAPRAFFKLGPQIRIRYSDLRFCGKARTARYWRMLNIDLFARVRKVGEATRVDHFYYLEAAEARRTA